MSATLLNVSSGVTAVFIIGMIWLRTRMQYLGLVRRAPGHKLQLEKLGRLYFAAAAVLLGIGWFAAPALAAALWPATVANPALTRVIWFLLTYYVFIFVHRVLLARGTPVFKTRETGAA